MPSVFLDTNVILYAAAGRKNKRAKSEIAAKIIGAANFAISYQVLQEFYVNFLRLAGSTKREVDGWIADLLKFDCIAGNADLFLKSVEYSRRYQLSYWDGAIVAAANYSGAPILYTEDLNHTQKYGTVTAVNPFLDN